MSSISGQPSSRDGNNNSSSSSTSLIQQELEEQKRRETEIAAMYQARQQQQQQLATPPSNDVISRDKSSDRLTAAAATTTTSTFVPPTFDPSTSAVPDGRSHRGSTLTEQPVEQRGRSSREMTFSSPGEALVYREMMEHRRRESELRRYWKEIGYELPVVSPATDDEDADMRVTNDPEMTSRKTSEPHAVNRKPSKTAAGESDFQQRVTESRESKSRDQKPSTARPEVIVIDKRSIHWSRPTEVNSNDVTSKRRSSEKPQTTSGVSVAVQRNSTSGLSNSAADTNCQLTTGGAKHGGVWPPTGGRQELETDERIGESSDVTVTSSGQRGSRRSRTEAELIIEREVVETRKREAELRQLRETLTSE